MDEQLVMVLDKGRFPGLSAYNSGHPQERSPRDGSHMRIHMHVARVLSSNIKHLQQ